MTQPAEPEAYSPVMKAVHWTTVAVVFALLAIGWTMTSDLTMSKLTRGTLYGLHKSLGVSILFLTLFRISWRTTHRVPPMPPILRPWEIMVFKVVHYLIYALLIIQPLVGWMVATVSPHKSLFFGMFPLPDLPFLSKFGNTETLLDALEDIHATGAIVLTVLLALHVAAAFKHHFMIRDNVLLRMSPGFLVPFLRKLRKEP